MIKIDIKTYVGQKYLLNNLKADEKVIMQPNGFLKSFAIYSPLKDVQTKVYYDTKDVFFLNYGILISKNTYKSETSAELVVRAKDKSGRIEFLNNIPDTFIFRIDKYKKVTNLENELEDYLLQLYPTGFGVDVKEKIKQLKPYMEVVKKRKRYKVLNPNGLKVVLSFEDNIYINHYNGSNKSKLNILEIRLENHSPKNATAFKDFDHELITQNPKIISIKNSDFDIGEEYLGIKLTNITDRGNALKSKYKPFTPIKQLKESETAFNKKMEKFNLFKKKDASINTKENENKK